ncbi:DUF2173 family protein [Solemya velum gill symbiont]|uniref:DUF2173 family protein n=1 Tax=Solemya velum gill symbiont TaxID=2340 RepID=UPI002118026E|nr:DUF2173 family protein [Solemya velum gill symbiont]
MIKRLLASDGVLAVCSFRDDGAHLEGYGFMPDEMLRALTGFAHEYKRIVQGNQDQLSMFTQMRGWTPPGGLDRAWQAINCVFGREPGLRG